MAIYLDEGAILQGTDKPKDYLPRIHSRFEGTEMMCYSSLLNLGELDHSAGPNCQNVRISGLTLKNGASWNVHMIYCDHIVTDHCTFASEGVWNGDGWDPDSSTNCTLFARSSGKVNMSATLTVSGIDTECTYQNDQRQSQI